MMCMLINKLHRQGEGQRKSAYLRTWICAKRETDPMLLHDSRACRFQPRPDCGLACDHQPHTPQTRDNALLINVATSVETFVPYQTAQTEEELTLRIERAVVIKARSVPQTACIASGSAALSSCMSTVSCSFPFRSTHPALRACLGLGLY